MGDRKTQRLYGNYVFGARTVPLSPISCVVPYLQQAPFSIPISSTTKSRSCIFNYCNTNRQRKTASLTKRTNTTGEAAPVQKINNICFVPFGIPSVSLLPSKSSFAYEHRHPFRFMLQDPDLIPARSITLASIGTVRSFSSSSILSFNRLVVSPQTIRCRTPVQRTGAKISSRNASSSGKGSKNEKEILEKDMKSNDSKSSSRSLDNLETRDTNKIQKFVDSTVSTVRTNVGSAEATIKRAVEELSTGDLLAVYGIVFLIVMIAVLPSMIRRMQASHRDGTHIDPEDPVIDLARMIRNEYAESIKRNYGNEETKEEDSAEVNEERSGGSLGLDRIVADLLKSSQIQEAANNLVVNVIQSPQFKIACQMLLKELLKDLMEDPDTLKQVIQLLQNAIADEKIKEAAIQLATDIFGDNRVLDELVTLVQRLGVEDKVQNATQALLVESAHNALNDPEILDHSMEFATDVVGDDVVQQTAGEALYNTMSYAFRPTLSVLLTVLGVGLIFVSITAFRNVNRTPSESADRAFLNAVEKTTSRLLKLIFLPVDFLIACKDAMVSIILFPFRIISSGVTRAGKLGQTLLGSTRDWMLWLIYLPAQLLSSLFSGSKHILETMYTNSIEQLNRLGCAVLSGSKHTFEITYADIIEQLNRVGRVVDMSRVGVFNRELLMLEISGCFHRAKLQWIILNHQVADKFLCLEKSRKTLQEMLTTLAKFPTSLQHEGKEYVDKLSKGYHSLNQNLADFAIFIEQWIRRMSGTV